jgi:hypothetical protein
MTYLEDATALAKQVKKLGKRADKQAARDAATIAALRAQLATQPTPPVTPPALSTAFGWCVNTGPGESYAAAVARLDALYGPGHALRRFFNEKQVPTWTGLPTNRVLILSFKGGLTDAQAPALFAAAPTGKCRCYWTYYHEPEENIEAGEFTAAQYRAEWTRLRALQVAANPALQSCLILMAWSLDKRSKRTWPVYYAGDDVIDVLGWDAYNAQSTAAKGVYSTPADVFGPCVEVSHGEGKPFGFAEWGSVLAAGDTGARRAAWMTAAGAYHAQVGALFSTYFDSPVGGEYRLLDAPSQAAMRALVTT